MIDFEATEDVGQFYHVYAKQLFCDLLNRIECDRSKLADPSGLLSEEGALYSLWVTLTRYLAVQEWDAETLIEDVDAHVKDETKTSSMFRLIREWQKLSVFAKIDAVSSQSKN